MTTAAIAKKLGRNFIMIEENEKYIKFGKYRIESVKFENSDIAKAKFDEKLIKVSLSDMILNKFFNVGEKFYLKNTNLNATLNKDVKLEYNGKIYDIHTLAAILKNSKSKRLNGFNYWEVLRNQKKISIAAIRENFRNFIINK